MSNVWTGTYRLQINQDFQLPAAIEILPYLKKLGISHVYLSPCLQAAPGSMHGYDVTDPTSVNLEIGGEPAGELFISAIKKLDLKVLLDIVPNHMSASSDNAWWDDVLRHGPFSEFAPYFDIRLEEGAPFVVQVCSLGRAYGDVLQSNELSLVLENGLPRVAYFDNTWPISPSSLELVLTPGAAEPANAPADPESYHRAAAAIERRLSIAFTDGTLARRLREINADRDRLDALLQRQFYQLHSWRLAGELSNYRRFFDVDSLVGIRTELPVVMHATHARIEKMIANGELDGLRIDHPDGLRDPCAYFKELRKLLPEGRVYVEKILENDERLNVAWAVDGTVGYDFLSKVNRLWMDDQRLDALTAIYSDFTKQSVNIAALVRQKKRDIINSSFSADLERLSTVALGLARSDRKTRDLSPRQLQDALAAVTVGLPIYRTYRTIDRIDSIDKQILTESVQRARSAAPAVETSVFDFLLNVLTKTSLTSSEGDFVAKWQQLAPAVMAKGVEDTTFYCFDRLLSCNEVGASASLVGISADKFHEFCHYLSETWPNNQLTTSTHDTKRSEDVRTRISLLSEIPDRWAEALHQWSLLTEPSWKGRTPDRHAEYLLYQTMIGAWPIDKDRCWQYMLKACREAKIRTSWHEPNIGYEANIQSFTLGVFENTDFLRSLRAFIDPLVKPGRVNSLAQTLIKMVIPGVPDFYQGTELWDLSLVDPDNRRPVDYGKRRELLERCEARDAGEVLQDWESGLPKLWLTNRLLKLRRERAVDFGSESKYQPLIAQGSRMGNLFPFRRGENLIAVVPRFTLSVGDDWGDTRLPLPGGVWVDAFTDAVHGGSVAPATLFAKFPVALLVRGPE